MKKPSSAQPAFVDADEGIVDEDLDDYSPQH